MVIWLVEQLQSRGFRPGIAMRVTKAALAAGALVERLGDAKVYATKRPYKPAITSSSSRCC